MKKILKKVLIGSLCAVVFMSSICISAYAKPLDNYKIHNSGWLGFGGTWDYRKNNDGYDTITVIKQNDVLGYDKTIPEKIDDHTVTQIGEGDQISYITHVYIDGNASSNLTRIGKNAFNSYYYVSPNETNDFLKNVKYIGDGAFRIRQSHPSGDIYGLQVASIDLGKCEYIGEYAFLNSCEKRPYSPSFKITMKLPEVPCDVGSGAFMGGSMLTLPEGKDLDLGKFKYIRSQVFSGCSNLKGKLILSDKETTDERIIGDRAFMGCSGITGADLANFSEIQYQAFCNCTGLNDYINTINVKTIGDSAFENCKNLKTVNLGGVENIGVYAFKNCENLNEIIELNPLAKSTDKKASIGTEAFKGCSNLKMPNKYMNLKNCDIGDRAFENCSSLEGTVLLSKNSKIGVDAFKGCEKIRFRYDNKYESESIDALIYENNVPQADMTKEFYQVDDATGVIVQAEPGVYNPELKLVVKEIDGSDIVNAYGSTTSLSGAIAYNANASESTSTNEDITDIAINIDVDTDEDIENIKFYKISVVDEQGSEIQPNGKVTVMIPIPEDYDEGDLDAIRVNSGDDRHFQESIVTIDNTKYCAFETDHFSTYSLKDTLSYDDISQILNVVIWVSVAINLALVGVIVYLLRKRNEGERHIENTTKENK